MERTVIIGAGQAGGRAAVALRANGYGGEIILVGQEARAPYERPPLSKEVLLGAAQAGAALVNPESVYHENSIELRLDMPVRWINSATRELTFMDGDRLGFQRLILATGARARRLEWPGSEAAKPYYLRTCDDAEVLRRTLSGRQGDIAIIGGGFIGLEVAASARQLGWTVTVIELGQQCLERVLPSASARVLVDLHERHGTRFRWGASVKETKETNSRIRLLLNDDESLNVDVVVVGIGSEPNMKLAEAAGLECGNGILVDDQCRTSVSDIYAIGDAAIAPNRWFGKPARLESWENAERQAEQVARVICGLPTTNDAPPWFWTDQFDRNVQIVGVPTDEDQMTVEPGKTPDQYVHLYSRGDVITGAVLFNSGRRRRALSRQMSEMRDAAAAPCSPAESVDSMEINA
ncbi:NAD(P)/FAD-dependent oxidoreductase [Parasphingopyxis lamellibrachiae]|uniref:3-phenylpropionate/trans-cinnamate dioxygenase ferredoxin reductase subunit n=1 Tax=Parasphingopyxis lamellibrachiae TaxID=680125 RepID=A0A3D9F8R1_9SPHN|nr:FAD-dependent oxidoreductase [Parasphingopyxis lamellibrachiae]RED13349.1 3-phenylpropionate/trans-cinnamate dioxygenase ferredoxin reductase subunit [Parasphingopyxis lamellibrachiae]